ncbi:hypothetical protein JCM3765_005761 [Sporobolomyces pararoseus]
MSGTKKIDYLSRLPPELLEDIFGEVQLSRTPLLGPLSKSLLPFVQQPLFEDLCVKTYEALEFLAETVVKRPEVGGYIKILHFHVDMAENENQAKKRSKEGEDTRTPSNKLIKRLLLSLVQVRSLVLTGSTRFASLVLDPVVAASSLPLLRTLHLASTFNNLRDPFHPCHYQSLQFYSELRLFKLSVLRSSKSMQAYPKTQVEPFPFRSEILDVSLSGPLSSSLPSVNNLLTSLGSLPMIALHDTSKESQMLKILDEILDPENLDYLHLKRFAADGGPPDSSFLVKLERFKNLTSLVFEGTCSNVSAEFYSSLRALKQLEHLAFGEEAQVSLRKLTKLVTGPEKLKSLHFISFDNVKGEVGTRLDDEGIPYWDDEYGWTPYPDWILPEWTAGFTEIELVTFVRVAKKEGIQVEGTAIEAIGVHAMYEEEEENIGLWEEEDEGCCDIDEEEYESD